MIQLATARRRGVMIPQIWVGDTIHREAARWADRVAANSGTLTTQSVPVASKFLWERDNRSWRDKFLWCAPMLGNNLAAARTPLVDWLGGGLMANTGFVDGDYSEAGGLVGNGSSKILNTNIYPVQLGRASESNNGGIGVWMTAVDQSGTTSEPIGCYNVGGGQRFVLDLRNTTTNEFFSWGSAANIAASGVNATAANHYGQRSSATSRTYWRSGLLIDTDTTSDTATGSADNQLRLMGSGPTLLYCKGTCALAYMTSGDLTAVEVLDMHNCLNTYLKTASGK